MKKSMGLLGILMIVFLTFATANQVYAQSAQRTGEVTKIDANSKSFVVKTARGETNILTTDATAYKKGEQEIGFNDLMVGDSLVVMGVRKGSDVEAQEITVEEMQTDDMDMM